MNCLLLVVPLIGGAKSVEMVRKYIRCTAKAPFFFSRLLASWYVHRCESFCAAVSFAASAVELVFMTPCKFYVQESKSSEQYC